MNSNNKTTFNGAYTDTTSGTVTYPYQPIFDPIKYCPYCGKLLPEVAELRFCPYCGKEIPRTYTSGVYKIYWNYADGTPAYPMYPTVTCGYK